MMSITSRTRSQIAARVLPPLALAIVAGCSYLPASLGGTSTLHPASSTSNSTNTTASSDGAAAASGDEGAEAGPPIGPIEKNLIRILGTENVYSSAAVQGTPSPLCPVPEGKIGVSVLELDPDKRTLDCFAFRSSESGAAKYESLRDFQDHGNIFRAVVWALPETKSNKVSVSILDGVFYAIEEGRTASILFAKLSERAGRLDRDFAFRYFDKFIDVSQASIDVLAPDVATAKAVRLPEAKQRLLAKALEVVKEAGAAKSKAAALALQKVHFPAAVKDSDVTLAIKAAREFIATSGKSEIESKSVKKAAMTSRWKLKRNQFGVIQSRMADVTVGFERTDDYAIDPNHKCAFATFEVKAEYDGRRYDPPVATGMATGWTNILCARIR